MRGNRFVTTLIVLGVLVAFLFLAPSVAPAQGQARVITQELGSAEEISPWMDANSARALANALASNQTKMVSVWTQPKREWYLAWLGFIPMRREPYAVVYRITNATTGTYQSKKLVRKR